MQPALDLVIYGATGFTGRQAAERVARDAPADFRWAIAGRNRAKLDALAQTLSPTPSVIVADSADEPAVDAMVAQTRCVLTTAGPFARYGEPVLAACAKHGVDYVDITGETPWVRRMIDRYHDEAVRTGARIVPFCGFDSVPADLGVLLLADHAQQTGRALGRITGYYQAKGGFNGGTLASALNLLERERASDLANPFLLNPDPKTDRATWSAHADPRGSWRAPGLDRWAAPFFMGPVNTRVVRRSAALFAETPRSYGSAFAYQEGLLMPSRVAAMAATASLAAFAVGGQSALLRKVAAKLGPSPGQGPTEAQMDGGFFRVRFVEESVDGARVAAEVSGPGDPGNRVTVQILCESAFSLLLDRDRLPERAGVLTPAVAFEHVLIDRLRASGMRLTLLDG
jgi:short subunit dehydrogenase-like uncharacterized protein